MSNVAILFCQPDGVYQGRGLDLWDEARDARLYNGTMPVVAHPPCQLWVNMAAVNWKRYGKQKPAWYIDGEDGGCFASALQSVSCCGGVLEHPASSHAWEHYGVMKPQELGWSQVPGKRAWVCEVWQSAYGHAARKRTWLVYVSPRGYAPAELDWSRKPGTNQVGWFDRKKPTLSKRAANATPPAFADALIALARGSR